MSIFDTDLIGGVSSGLKNFSYGHHPSIVMWSNGPASQKEEESGLFGGFAKSLESLPVVGESAVESFNSFKFDAMVSE